MTIPHASRLAALLIALASPAPAQELALSVGAIGFGASTTPALAAELRGTRFAAPAGIALSAAAGAEIDRDGDLWVGAGLFAGYALSPRWRAELSVMPGYYDADGGADLGGGLQFRSTLGLSRLVGRGARLGLGLSHKSNAGIENLNPGEDALFVTLARRF